MVIAFYCDKDFTPFYFCGFSGIDALWSEDIQDAIRFNSSVYRNLCVYLNNAFGCTFTTDF